MSVTDITIGLMSVTVNTRMNVVGRWQPDSPARVLEAALALSSKVVTFFGFYVAAPGANDRR